MANHIIHTIIIKPVDSSIIKYLESFEEDNELLDLQVDSNSEFIEVTYRTKRVSETEFPKLLYQKYRDIIKSMEHMWIEEGISRGEKYIYVGDKYTLYELDDEYYEDLEDNDYNEEIVKLDDYWIEIDEYNITT